MLLQILVFMVSSKSPYYTDITLRPEIEVNELVLFSIPGQSLDNNMRIYIDKNFHINVIFLNQRLYHKNRI